VFPEGWFVPDKEGKACNHICWIPVQEVALVADAVDIALDKHITSRSTAAFVLLGDRYLGNHEEDPCEPPGKGEKPVRYGHATSLHGQAELAEDS
jgi:hypothetical protein